MTLNPQCFSNIAIAMELAGDKKNVTAEDKARILAVWNTVLNFISGEDFFRPMLQTDHENYVNVVKETQNSNRVPIIINELPTPNTQYLLPNIN